MREQIREWLISEVIGQDAASELHDDTPLINSGILDSISLLRLIRFLEDEYQVEVPVADVVNLSSFGTVANILAFMESLRVAPTA
jgi:acyl carrier protein